MYRTNPTSGRRARIAKLANAVPSLEPLESRSYLSATLLNDINSSGIATPSLPEQFKALGSQALFLAYSPSNGQMLWSTGGTPQSTTLVKDINPSPSTGAFVGFGGDSIVIGSTYYFTGADSAHGPELWKSDGTANGTQLVADLVPGAAGSYPDAFTNFNGKLAFEASGTLYVSDGTAGGTIAIGNYNPIGNGGSTDRMAVLGNQLFFFRYGTSSPDGHNTGELWETDGTVAGTKMVVDLSPGNDGQSGINSVPSNLVTVGGQLYFAGDDGTHGWELWQSDGTAANTKMVADLAPVPDPNVPVIDGSYPGNLTNVNGTLYFTASPSGSNTELYKLDGNGQPSLIRPFASGGPSSAQNLTPSGNVLYFTATDGNHGNELWRTDGTAAGTSMVSDINPGAADAAVTNLTNVNGKLYFSANDGTHGTELWTSDGTAGGTVLVQDIEPGSAGSDPGPFLSFHGQLLFAATTDDVGREPRALALTAPAAPTAVLTVSGTKGVSRNNMPTVFGTAVAGATVYLFSDGVQIGSTTAGADGSYRVSSSVPLADGSHTLNTSVFSGGQTSRFSSPMSLNLDSTPPTITLTKTAANQIDVKFSEDVSTTFGRAAFSIANLADGLRIDPSFIRVTYNSTTHTAKIVFTHLKTGTLPTGHYRIRFTSPKTMDNAGNPLTAASFGFTVRKTKK